MNTINKHHSLALFISYIIVLNFKNTNYIDGLVLFFLAAYIGLTTYLEVNKQPDIKGELEARITLMEHQHNEAMKTIIFRNESDLKKMDSDIKDMKSKVAAIGSLKSVGLSQTNIKF